MAKWTEEDEEIMREVFLKEGIPGVRERGLLEDWSDRAIYSHAYEMGISRREYQRKERRRAIERIKSLAKKGFDAFEIEDELDGEYCADYILKLARSANIVLPPVKDRMKNEKFTEEEDQLIREKYPHIGMAVADEIGRTRQSVSGRAFRLGVSKEGYGSVKDIDPQMVRRMYWDLGLTLKEVGHVLDVSHETIRLFMEKNGIPTRDRGVVFEPSPIEELEEADEAQETDSVRKGVIGLAFGALKSLMS